MLTRSSNWVICKGDRVTTFAITDTKISVVIVNLSTQGNTKLLQQMKSGLKSKRY